MALTITQEQFATLQTYSSAEDYVGGWAYLASVGDNYADNAYAVTSGQAEGIDKGFEILVYVHWANVTGDTSAYQNNFESVAIQHFQQYVGYIENNGYSLPDSKQIEKSYRDAVEYHNMPAAVAFDGVFTRSYGELANLLWPKDHARIRSSGN